MELDATRTQKRRDKEEEVYLAARKLRWQRTSQLTSDHHNRAQMIVLIPKVRHIATLRITW